MRLRATREHQLLLDSTPPGSTTFSAADRRWFLPSPPATNRCALCRPCSVGAPVRTSTQSLHQLHTSFKRLGLHYIDFCPHRDCSNSAYPPCHCENSQFSTMRDEPRLKLAIGRLMLMMDRPITPEGLEIYSQVLSRYSVADLVEGLNRAERLLKSWVSPAALVELVLEPKCQRDLEWLLYHLAKFGPEWKDKPPRYTLAGLGGATQSGPADRRQRFRKRSRGPSS